MPFRHDFIRYFAAAFRHFFDTLRYFSLLLRDVMPCFIFADTLISLRHAFRAYACCR